MMLPMPSWCRRDVTIAHAIATQGIDELHSDTELTRQDHVSTEEIGPMHRFNRKLVNYPL